MHTAKTRIGPNFFWFILVAPCAEAYIEGMKLIFSFIYNFYN